jgi:hypothetical protein
MKAEKLIDEGIARASAVEDAPGGPDVPPGALESSFAGRPRTPSFESWQGAVIGELVALSDAGRTPFVLCPGQPGRPVRRGRTAVELPASEIGRNVILVFENGDDRRPVVIGVVRQPERLSLAEPSTQVEVDADGGRMVVTCRDELILRCGRASITLTKGGEVLIRGTYISSRSSGVNRIRGGSVQIN